MANARQNAMATYKKVDWFTADRKLAENVTDFMMRTVWWAEVKDEKERILAKEDRFIANYDSLKDSIIWDEKHEEELMRLKLARMEHEKQLDEWMKKAPIRWKMSDFAGLKEFNEDYKNEFAKNGEDGDFTKAIVNLLRKYNIDITGTEELEILANSIKGLDPASMKTTVTSDGNVWTDGRKNPAKIIVRRLAEILIVIGTVKPAKISPELKERYAKKTSGKKNSKKAKKAEKKQAEKKTVNLKAEVVVPAHIEAQADEVANAPANME